MAPNETSSSQDARPALRSPASTEILVLVAELAQLLVMGLLLDLLLFGGVEGLGLVRLGVIAAVLVGFLKSHGWLVLFALQVSLFSREPNRPEMTLGVIPWLYGLCSLVLVAYAYLGKPFRNRVSKWMVTQCLNLLGMEEQTVTGSSETHSLSASMFQFIAIRFLVWMAITFVAMLALLRLPVTSMARSEWLRNAIENDFTVWPGASLLAMTLLLVIVFMEVSWRQLTGAQAKLYMRSSFILDHYRDLRMIVVRRLKMNKKLGSSDVPQKQLVERPEYRQ